MRESETYAYRVTKAVDILEAALFNTTKIARIAAVSPQELESKQAQRSAVKVLHKMKCVERKTFGLGRIPNDWKVVFSPGPNCEDCHFFRKYKNSQFKGRKHRCARIESAKSTSSQGLQFPES